MRKIIVTESQLRRLIESLYGLGDKESGISKYPGSITTVSPTKTNNDDELEYTEPSTGDDVTNTLTTQRGIRGYNCRWR